MHKRRETGEYFYAVEVCVYLGSGFYTCPEEDTVMTTQLSSRSSCAGSRAPGAAVDMGAGTGCQSTGQQCARRRRQAHFPTPEFHSKVFTLKR